MKKVLLASTALVMTAGMAAADVSLSGYAEIGIVDIDNEATGEDNTEFHNDIDVKFTLSGETDGGLAFGATIDLDEITLDDSEIDPSDNPASVFVSGDFGTITMGDTDGAFDWALTEIAWGTSIADDHTAHPGWSGNSGLDGSHDGQIARYDYSFGDFAFGVSAELNDDDADDDLDGDDDDDVYGIGFKWAGDFGGTGIGVGIGYQDGDEDEDIAGISLSADFAGGFSARLNYSAGDVGGDDDYEHMGIGVAYQMDALLLEANYGEFDGDTLDADGFGLAMNYDLGGGAVVMVGYGSGDAGGSDVDTFSAGLGLSF